MATVRSLARRSDVKAFTACPDPNLTFDVRGRPQAGPLDGGVRCNEWAPTVMALKKAQMALGARARTMDKQGCNGLHFDGDSALEPMQGHLPH